MIRRPPRSTPLYSSAASDVYKRQAGSAVSAVACGVDTEEPVEDSGEVFSSDALAGVTHGDPGDAGLRCDFNVHSATRGCVLSSVLEHIGKHLANPIGVGIDKEPGHADHIECDAVLAEPVRDLGGRLPHDV